MYIMKNDYSFYLCVKDFRTQILQLFKFMVKFKVMQMHHADQYEAAWVDCDSRVSCFIHHYTVDNRQWAFFFLWNFSNVT